LIQTPEIIKGNAQRLTISYHKLAQDLALGNKLLLDDGNIHLEVSGLLPGDEIEGVVTQGGILSSHRGVNIPGVRLRLPALTQKDLEDIDFAVSRDIDFLALSFVQSASDIQTLKDILSAKGSEIGVIAKIEKGGGLENIEAIVDKSDAVMVARGDLALETSFEEIPMAQKHIISVCRRKGVPVITATQMLESMVKARKPLRAETTDIANAIIDGTDALMLSGETAIGDHPTLTIETMARIAVKTEQVVVNEADILIMYTHDCRTVHRVRQQRPATSILALTSNLRTYYQLALSGGVKPIFIGKPKSEALTFQAVMDHVYTFGSLPKGAVSLSLASIVPDEQQGLIEG
jgi:pyruvate kinase